jgi:hypothetical protein
MGRLRHCTGPDADLDCLLKDAAPLYPYTVCVHFIGEYVDSCLQPSHKHLTPPRSFSGLSEMPSYAPTTRLRALMTTVITFNSHSLPDPAAFWSSQSHVQFIPESSPAATQPFHEVGCHAAALTTTADFGHNASH